MPDVFEFPFTDDQHITIHELGHCLRYGTRKALAAPRGDGKTSILRGLKTKYTLTGECPFGLYVGATDTKAEQSRDAIKHRIQSSMREGAGNKQRFYPNTKCVSQRGIVYQTPFGADYPFECAVASYVCRAPSRANNVTTGGGMRIHVKWAGDQLIWPSIAHGDEDECMSRWGLTVGKLGAILLACGYTSSVLQGANVLDMRPTFVTMDDLDNREAGTVEKSVDCEKIEKLIDTTIAGMKGQGNKMGIAFLCTVSSRRSSAFLYTDPTKKPAYAGKRIKRVWTWPERMDMWEKYMLMRQHGMQTVTAEGSTRDPFGRDAHAFYLDNEEEMDRGSLLNNYNVHDTTELPDGTHTEHSSLQNVFNFIADNSLEAFKTEYQQEPPIELMFESSLDLRNVMECEGDFERGVVDQATTMIVRAIDIRKTEMHWTCLATDEDVRNRLVDYDVRTHEGASQETTVEQAEELIYQSLHRRADEWDAGYRDIHGGTYACDLTLVDKGWKGSWNTEDGEEKSWASQPVEQFCRERGLRRYLPAKGQPGYKSPAPADGVIVGDHWHMNRGAGIERNCTEVIWDVIYWRSLVEENIMLGTDRTAPEVDRNDPIAVSIAATMAALAAEKLKDKFVLFAEESGVWANHKRFAEHIRAGAQELAESRRSNTRTRKRKRRRDHWWDASAMMLVARSIETWFRANLRPKPAQLTSAERSVRAARTTPPEEIGAR